MATGADAGPAGPDGSGRAEREAGREAAFFDLDKTVIAKASIAAFARDFQRAGLLRRRSLVRAAWTHLVYLRVGASAKRLARMRSSVLSVTTGWEQAHVRRIVTEALSAVIEPIVYTEARELIGAHLAAGRVVFIVSAAPAEIVEPLARHLGVHEAIASQAAVDPAGRYTGTMERYAYGPMKAALMRQIAERDGIDLDRSYAYTDSVTDLPMLEAVGHPVAVNPDRPLRRIARLRGWEVRRFEGFSSVAGDIEGAPARQRAARATRTALIIAAPVVVAAGGAAAAVMAHRRPGRAAGAGSAPVQLARSFFAANNDRPSSARSTTSFFMAGEPT